MLELNPGANESVSTDSVLRRVDGGDAHKTSVSVVTKLREQHRQRQDLHRAEKSLTLQIRAKCRRLVGGDLDQADALYSAMSGKGEHPLAETALSASGPFLEARARLLASRKEVERQMVKLARSLPVAGWVESTRGLGLAGVAAIIGECGDLSAYSNPAKLWKRMGLAVMGDGSRQRRVPGLEAIEHGYAPARRAVVWNVGACMIKAGGPYREVYETRKAYEVERDPTITKGHAHNRAKRYMEKRIIRDLWRAWRDSAGIAS